ncbi:14780_t:CDS:1, partial [Gigaspora rosea]
TKYSSNYLFVLTKQSNPNLTHQSPSNTSADLQISLPTNDNIDKMKLQIMTTDRQCNTEARL